MKRQPQRPPSHNPRRNRPSFLLVELLVVTMLMGIFMIVLGQLFLITNTAQMQTQKQMADINRIDGLIAQLRRDVWDARALTADGSRLEIAAQNQILIWQSNPDGSITRKSNNAPPQNWPAMPALSFTQTGPIITLHVAATAHPQTLSLISQQLLQGTPK